MKMRVFIQPGQDFGVFVGGVVAHDKVKLLGLWGVAINRFEELQPLLMAMELIGH
jgi:hypothetical protein